MYTLCVDRRNELTEIDRVDLYTRRLGWSLKALDQSQIREYSTLIGLSLKLTDSQRLLLSLLLLPVEMKDQI